MAEQSYGDWIRSNPPLPTKEYKTKHMEQETSKIGNSDKSQTAVEWLFNIIKLKADSIPTKTAVNRRAKGVYVDCLMIIKEAKQMEKEQIVKAYSNGSNDRLKNRINDQYYNETYKQNT